MAGVWRNPGAVAAAAALGSHLALLLDAGGVAVPLACIQAAATGWIVCRVGGRPWLGLAVGLGLMAAAGLGARQSAGMALLALGGGSHAVLYAGLLAWFGGSLRRDRLPVVTGFARQLNPAFRPSMEGYTRKVTWAWTAFCAGQLLGSALLGVVAPGWWPRFVGLPNLLLVLLMAAGERTVRGWRFPDMAHTSLPAIIRAVRARSTQAAAARASGPAAGCP